MVLIFACTFCMWKKLRKFEWSEIFAWILTSSLHAVKIEYRQLTFCQIFERPTQRLLISCTIETEAKMAHKPGVRSPCCAVGHRWDAWALACKIKTYENLFCGLFGQIYENMHQRKYPTIPYFHVIRHISLITLSSAYCFVHLNVHC